MNPHRLFHLDSTDTIVRGGVCVVLALVLGQCLFPETVQAQGVYKAIGPGGKVIYTDKPVRQPDGRLVSVDAVEYAHSGARFDSTTRWSDPAFSARRSGDAAADAALETSRRAAAAAAEEAARAAAQAHQNRVEASRNKAGVAPAAPVAVVNPAVPPPAAPGALAAPAAVKIEPPIAGAVAAGHGARATTDPRIEKTMVEMMAIRHLIEQSVLVCSANQPADASRLSGMLAQWRERNNALLAKHQKILHSSFSSAQIRDMEEAASVANRTRLERGNAVVEEVRLKWCAQMMSDIGKGALDPVGKSEFAAVLASVR